MANPNLGTVTSIIGDTITAALTTTTTTTLLAGVTNKSIKVNSIIVSNINGTNSASCTFSFYDGTNDRYFSYLITIPAGSSVVLVDKNNGFYIKEGCELRGGANLNSYLNALISYETMS